MKTAVSFSMISFIECGSDWLFSSGPNKTNHMTKSEVNRIPVDLVLSFLYDSCLQPLRPYVLQKVRARNIGQVQVPAHPIQLVQLD